jgi:hypothetical protein
MKKPFGKTKIGSILKSVVKVGLNTVVDIIPAGESVKKIIKNVAANGNNTQEATGSKPELFKIVRAVFVIGLAIALMLGKIDFDTLEKIVETIGK